MHSKPEALKLNEVLEPDDAVTQIELHPLLERLIGYQVIRRPEGVNIAAGILLQRPVARWAHNTALSMLLLLVNAIDHKGWKELLVMGHGLEMLSP